LRGRILYFLSPSVVFFFFSLPSTPQVGISPTPFPFLSCFIHTSAQSLSARHLPFCCFLPILFQAISSLPFTGPFSLFSLPSSPPNFSQYLSPEDLDWSTARVRSYLFHNESSTSSPSLSFAPPFLVSFPEASALEAEQDSAAERGILHVDSFFSPANLCQLLPFLRFLNIPQLLAGKIELWFIRILFSFPLSLAKARAQALEDSFNPPLTLSPLYFPSFFLQPTDAFLRYRCLNAPHLRFPVISFSLTARRRL